MKRPRAWQAAQGDTAIALLNVLKPHAGAICAAGVDIYESVCMKTGIDLAKLQAQEEPLFDLISLDPRGGIFKQRDMASGLAMIIATDAKLSKMIYTPAAVAKYGGEDAVLGIVAYKLRVMCSHVRRRYDANCIGLERINDTIRKAPKCTEPVAKKPRHVRNTTLNPFINFRHDDIEQVESSDDDEDEDPTAMVATWFDVKLLVAKMVTNHGDIKLADVYTPDATGMIKAEWMDPKACMSIELPASCLKDGVITMYEAPAAEPKTKAKAKAKTKITKGKPAASETKVAETTEVAAEVAAESDEDAEAVGTDPLDPKNLETLESESEIVFKIANGHKNDVCIFAQSDSKDKAQILNVTVAMCKDAGKTPREICQSVKNALIAYFETSLRKPVKGNQEQLDVLRSKAVEARNSLL